MFCPRRFSVHILFRLKGEANRVPVNDIYEDALRDFAEDKSASFGWKAGELRAVVCDLFGWHAICTSTEYLQEVPYMAKHWEHFLHDVEIGMSKEEAFEQTALGLTTVSTGLHTVTPRKRWWCDESRSFV